MFKDYKKLCEFIALLFRKVEKADKLDTIQILKYSRNDIDEIIFQCIEAKYILNAEAFRDESGSPHITERGKPYVSLLGYQFLNNLRSDVALAKARKADIKGWIALVISILTFLIYFIEKYQVIIDFFK